MTQQQASFESPADDRHQQAAPRASGYAVSPPPALVSSDELFGDAKELHIEHRGSLYRLQKTSLGKLILTK